MALRVRCPNAECGKTYSVADDQLGRTAVCKHCGRRFTVAASGKETLKLSAYSDTADSAPAKPAKPTADVTPKKLGRFEIRSRLGAGAFGAVYRGL